MAGETAAQSTPQTAEAAAKPTFAEMASEWSASFDAREEESHEEATKPDIEGAKDDVSSEKEPETPDEPALPTIEELQELAKANKAAEILRALGVKAPEKVAAKQWADYRAAQKRLQDQQGQFQTLVGQLEQKYSRFDRAQKLHDGGDLLGAFAEFFGGHDKIEEITTKIIQQKGARDPEAWREIQRLKADREKEEKEKAAAEERRQAEAQAQQVAHARTAVLQQIQKEAPAVYQALSASTVPTDAQTVAHLLITAARQSMDETGEDMTVEEALKFVSSDIGRLHQILTAASGADPGGNRAGQDPGDIPEQEPDQGGQTPAQPRARALSHQRARGAGVKPAKRSYQESLSATAAELARALGGGGN
jgi:hypothetical protein